MKYKQLQDDFKFSLFELNRLNRSGSQEPIEFTCRWFIHTLFSQMFVVHIDKQNLKWLNSDCPMVKYDLYDDRTTVITARNEVEAR